MSYTSGTTAPIITRQPPGQSQIPGFDVMFTVGVVGTPPFSYQWLIAETNLPDATNSYLIVSNIQEGNLGNYRVVITNMGGSIVSSNAPLEFGQVTAWGQRDTSGWATVTNGAINILAVAGGFVHDLVAFLFLPKADACLRWNTRIQWKRPHGSRYRWSREMVFSKP